MEQIQNSLNWFEIPATDFERATKFYGALYETELHTQKMGDADMAFLPMSDKGVGGAIVKCMHYVPSQDGSVVYLNGGTDLQNVLNRVEQAGGKVTVPKFEIGEHGFCAFFLDTEGNKVGLHSNK
jgi:predicted enzyme related to lactoylglutathione lyase